MGLPTTRPLPTNGNQPENQPTDLIRSNGDDSGSDGPLVRTHPKSTKTHVPPPQQVRMVQRHIAGQSIRQISREENRDRQTVTKIVRSEEMLKYVCSLRQRLYGLGEDALHAVENALCEQKDARLGYRLLMDIGVVPHPMERQPIRANEEVFDP